MSIWAKIKRWFSRMIPRQSIEDAFEIEIATSPEMLEAFEMWRSMFYGAASWNDEKTPSRRTAAQIANEYGRVTVVEHESTVSGSPRADWLNEQYQPFVEQENLQNIVSMLAAGGEIILKPSPNSKNGITIAVYENNQYYAVRYNSEDELMRFITKKHIQRDGRYYTLLEDNDYDEFNRRLTITYKAFMSDYPDILGVEIPLSQVEEWAHLRDVYPFVDVSPWFVHIKMPMQNDVEQSKRNGVSIYSKAVDTIRKLDEMGELTDHEFKGGRLKQELTSDMVRKNPDGSYRADSDIFLVLEGTGMPGQEFIKTYNPDPRIQAYSEREQKLHREIEFLCQLSYGMLSDAQQQDKTATEVHASLARFDNAIKSIQRTLQKKQKQLVTAMDEMATVYYPRVPAGNWDMSFFWDDSVIISAEEKAAAYNAELARLMNALSAGLIKPQIVMAFMIENSDYLSKLTDKQIIDALQWMPDGKAPDEPITTPIQ